MRVRVRVRRVRRVMVTMVFCLRASKRSRTPSNSVSGIAPFTFPSDPDVDVVVGADDSDCVGSVMADRCNNVMMNPMKPKQLTNTKKPTHIMINSFEGDASSTPCGISVVRNQNQQYNEAVKAQLKGGTTLQTHKLLHIARDRTSLITMISL
jgi:hypothetical protein